MWIAWCKVCLGMGSFNILHSLRKVIFTLGKWQGYLYIGSFARRFCQMFKIIFVCLLAGNSENVYRTGVCLAFRDVNTKMKFASVSAKPAGNVCGASWGAVGCSLGSGALQHQSFPPLISTSCQWWDGEVLGTHLLPFCSTLLLLQLCFSWLKLFSV